MKLYHRWKCPWCAAARQALENVGARVELVEVPYERAQRTEVMVVSGQARVPVLEDGDVVLVDSRRIVSHLYAADGREPYAKEARELADEIARDEAVGRPPEACFLELEPPPAA